MLLLVILSLCVPKVRNAGLFLQIAKAAADDGNIICGKMDGMTGADHVVWTQADLGKLENGTSRAFYTGVIHLSSGSQPVMTLENSREKNGTKCFLVGGTYNASAKHYSHGSLPKLLGMSSNSSIWTHNHSKCGVCSQNPEVLMAYRYSLTDSYWNIGRCTEHLEKGRNITFVGIQAHMATLKLGDGAAASDDDSRADETCNSKAVYWEYKHGCETNVHTLAGGDECQPRTLKGLWCLLGPACGIAIKDVHYEAEANKVNINRLICKGMKLANYTTKGLTLINRELSEEREMVLDNRLALEMLLSHQGGLCKYIGKGHCCSDIEDLKGNISVLINKMHTEIQNYLSKKVDYGILGNWGDWFSIFHFLQWIPIIIAVVLICCLINAVKR